MSKLNKKKLNELKTAKIKKAKTKTSAATKSLQKIVKLQHSIFAFEKVGDVHVVSDGIDVYAVCFSGELESILNRFKKHFKFEISFVDNKINLEIKKQLKEYFSGQRKKFFFKYKLYGTDFQKLVWNSLKSISYGKTVSYKDIGFKIGMNKGFQAIGQANGANPICLLLPCHRVIASTGQLSGYAGGAGLKRYLLSLENVDYL